MKSIKNIQFHKKIAVLLTLLMIVTFAVCPTFAATKNKKPEIREPRVNAGSYVVMSGSTSEIVYQQHAERKMSMGNITKLMTAMVVIDSVHDDSEYSNQVEINEKIDKYGDDFSAGQSITVDDLLKAMLIGGSDEAAMALAKYSAGNSKNFVREMNSKAVQIGLLGTKYMNPSGAYDVEHYSTAVDCAVALQYAVRYSKIKEMMGMDSATIEIIGKKKSKSKTFTGNEVGAITGSVDYPVKTVQYAGFTTKDYMQFIVVILDGAEEDGVVSDASELFEYGNYKASKNTIVKAGKCVGRAKVRGGAHTKVKAYTETKGFAYIPPEGSTDLVQTQVAMTSGLNAPLKAGDKVGEYRIYVADELKGTVDLVIRNDVPEGWIFSKIYISNVAVVIVLVILLFAALIILRLRAINKRKAKIQARKRNAKIRELAEKQEALDEDRKKRKWTYSNYYDAQDITDALNRKKK